MQGVLEVRARLQQHSKEVAKQSHSVRKERLKLPHELKLPLDKNPPLKRILTHLQNQTVPALACALRQQVISTVPQPQLKGLIFIHFTCIRLQVGHEKCSHHGANINFAGAEVIIRLQ